MSDTGAGQDLEDAEDIHIENKRQVGVCLKLKGEIGSRDPRV